MFNFNDSFREMPQYVTGILSVLENAGFSAYVVGGAVRDMVLGVVPHDYDVATSATPDAVVDLLEKNGIAYTDMAAKHGTVMALTGSGPVEITTFRIDGGYSDGRRPDEVGFTRDINEDVMRRDFTINSLYLDRDGHICDITGGIRDCRVRLIRTVGDPHERFAEDALRIMRALRFAAVLGFDIEDSTFAAMEDLADNLRLISAERTAAEFKTLVCAGFASRTIRKGYRILSEIIPELAECYGFDQHSVFHDKDVFEHTLAVLDGIPIENSKRDPELALAAVFHDLGKPSCFRINANGIAHMKGHPEKSALIARRVLKELKFPPTVINRVCTLIDLHDTFVRPERYTVHKFISENSIETVTKLCILQRADIMAHSMLGMKRMEKLEAITAIVDELKAEGAVFEPEKLDITGEDLIAIGFRQGPGIGNAMRQLFDMYMRGDVANEHDSLVRCAGELPD
ncbi:MAG: CCA tRNA nucleotidyltransferase [Saccharofermentans sp.]|nr:CCA tRNA nucleotidyltransferase [Mageeibacillus sp.]MCI1275024.1 CCA tRNA nucleotidyltransferase [Saccharofermentans sp.]